MGDTTKIEWCDKTWSPWWGCVEVSPACDHCYARELDHRFPILGQTHWGKDKSRRMFGTEHWRKPHIWDRRAQADGVRYRVFPSMCDPFEFNESLSVPRGEFFKLIAETPNLDWLVLTKRPQNGVRFMGTGKLRSNIWVGATVESRAYLHRIDELRKVDAAVRFLSLEPLLEDLGALNLEGIHWVIVGGESGPGARPMHPNWVRAIRRQCLASDVPFFFKQWGEHQNGSSVNPSQDLIVLNDGRSGQSTRDFDQETKSNWPSLAPVMMARVGKKAAGRVLDGRTWDELPLAALEKGEGDGQG